MCTVCTNSQTAAISLLQMIRTLLEDLPGIFAETAITQCAVGAALQVAEKLLVRYTLPFSHLCIIMYIIGILAYSQKK